MNTNIERAVEFAGGQSRLAAALGVTSPAISGWLRGQRPVPAARAVQIEQITGGVVRRWDLREDWHLIWPELVGADGAPGLAPQPVAAAETTA